ncbi:hypothetical protein [Mucilaginibacter lappiensis]|uniref:Uncharacterized protein n=1 Tax=Mucilaginibacter lappiensis TaxID=354630 RepID=A0A1N6V0X5_9SPHI|nr:hypothetical protein [Mucilaginibacter lappiensis]MBB6109003.1 hypothetical protein [Mucilaginibacter lappiensis]MBB6127401.1 hypothetical protein [Mucilaginibacter lappiensis]SIQ71477.1 hypothetical protein SAMN05421821_103240 [Mucilaginibacter lappiensis]
MSKLSLTHAELAALDALIAELQGEGKSVEAEVGNAAFITAVTAVTAKVIKVTVKATPVVVQVATAAIGGAAVNDETSKELAKYAKEGLPLDKLIELRKKFN